MEWIYLWLRNVHDMLDLYTVSPKPQIRHYQIYHERFATSQHQTPTKQRNSSSKLWRKCNLSPKQTLPQCSHATSTSTAIDDKGTSICIFLLMNEHVTSWPSLTCQQLCHLYSAHTHTHTLPKAVTHPSLFTVDLHLIR